jgi:purine-cytosine permease-like protein
MLPDQGCYEERYRLTFPVVRGAAFSVVPLIVAIFGHQLLPWVILAPVVFALATVPWLVAVASRKVAFRADMAGIMLGADPPSWPFRHASAVFVPWSDAEEIVLYQGGGPFG